MLKQFPLAFPFLLGFLIAATGQNPQTTAALGHADNGLLTAEMKRALARLGDLSCDAVRRRLAEMRPPAYQPGPVLLNEIIKRQQLPVCAGDRVERLKVILQPLLAYHERDGKLPIIVVRSEQPKAFVAVRAALIITSKLMLITSEAEMRGIVAHELVHEYFQDEQEQARKAHDESLLREIEFFCDVVAALSLREIGEDPAHFRRALERMTYVGITAGNATRRETKTHPSLDARVKLNQWLCGQLGQVYPTTTR